MSTLLALFNRIRVEPRVMLYPLRRTSLRLLLVYVVSLGAVGLLASQARGEDGGAGVSAAPVAVQGPGLPDVPGWVVSMGGPLGVALFLAYKAGQGIKVRVTVDLSDDDRDLLRGLSRAHAPHVNDNK